MSITLERARCACGGMRLATVMGLLAWILLPALASAQITLDGSLGPAGPVTPVGGLHYQIGADLGQVRGQNLFHSFGAFNVPTGGSATFLGPASIANILARVTGGQASTIDGVLRSEIPGANLFLLNPAGVLFKSGARLEVSGAFHASTADYLRFADGAKFHASLGRTSTLTVASPVAFGFLGPSAGTITVEGSELVNDGRTLSLIGGGVRLDAATLDAGGGRVNLASIAAAGEATLAASNGQTGLAVAPAATGTIGMLDGVSIRAGKLVIDGVVGAQATGRPALEVAATDEVTVRGPLFSAGDLRIHGDGDARPDVVLAMRVQMQEGGAATIDARTIGFSDISPFGETAGTVTLRATGSVEGFSIGLVPNFLAKRSADVTVTAGRDVVLGLVQAGSMIVEGRGGDVTIDAGRDVRVTGVVTTSSKALFNGSAGNVHVSAGRSLDIAAVKSDAVATQAGNVELNAGTALRAGGILTDGRNTANGGDVTLVAGTHMRVFGIETQSVFGRAGNVTIVAGGDFETSGGIRSSSPAGEAGNIMVRSRTFRSQGADLNTFAGGIAPTDPNASLDGGNITLMVGRLVDLRGAGLLSAVNRIQAHGGNITVTGPPRGAAVGRASSAATAQATPVPIVILNGAVLIADAPKGEGGAITILADLYARTADTVIRAASGVGQPGPIDVRADAELSTASSAAPLPKDFLAASALLRARCAARSASAAASSFAVGGRDAAPPEPGGWMASSPIEPAGDGAARTSDQDGKRPLLVSLVSSGPAWFGVVPGTACDGAHDPSR